MGVAKYKLKMVAAADGFPQLQTFEELFRNRYTEHDKDYMKAAKDGQRAMSDVPVMTPWRFNRGKNHRYSGGSHSRGRDRGGRTRYNRGQPPKGNDYHHYHKDYNDYEYSMQSSDRSSNRSGDWSSSDYRPYSRLIPDHAHTYPSIHEDNTSFNDTKTDPQPQHATPKETSDYDYQPPPPPLQTALDSFKNSPSPPPTESDVHAILNIAHDSNMTASKSKNLDKERSRKRKENSKKKPKLSSNITTSNSSLLVTSDSLNVPRIPRKSSLKGETASMILSELKTEGQAIDKSNKRKRKSSLIEEDTVATKSESENEHIDVEGFYDHPLRPSSVGSSNHESIQSVKQPFYASTIADIDHISSAPGRVESHNDPGSLVVRLPLSYRSKQSGVDDGTGGMNGMMIPIEEGGVSKSKSKKRKRRHEKHHGTSKKPALEKKGELKDQLTLRINLKRDHEQL